MLVEDPNAVRVQVNIEKQRAAERAARRASRIDRDLARQRDQAQADSLVRRLEKEYMKEQEKRKEEKGVKIEEERLKDQKRKDEKMVKIEGEKMKVREEEKRKERTMKDRGQEKRKERAIPESQKDASGALEWPWKEQAWWWESFKRDDQPVGGFPGGFFWFAFFACALLAAFSTAERNGWFPRSDPGQAFAIIWETVSFTIAVGGAASFLWFFAQKVLQYFSGILVFLFLWWGQGFLVLVMINFLASIVSNNRTEVQETASWWPWSKQAVLTADEKWQNNLFAEIVGGFDSLRGYIPALDDNPLAIVYKTLSVPSAFLGASGVTISLGLTQLGIGVKDQLTFAFNAVRFGVKEAWQVIRPFLSTDTLRKLRLVGVVVVLVVIMFVYKQEFTTQLMYNLFAIQPTATLYSYFMKRVKSSLESKVKRQIKEKREAPKKGSNQLVVAGTVLENTGLFMEKAVNAVAGVFRPTLITPEPEPSSVEQRLVTMLAGAGACTPAALEWLLHDVPLFCGNGPIDDALSVGTLERTRILSILMLLANSNEKLVAKIGGLTRRYQKGFGISTSMAMFELRSSFSDPMAIAKEALSDGIFRTLEGNFPVIEQLSIDEAKEEFDNRVGAFYSFENIFNNKDLFEYMELITSEVVDAYNSGKRGFIGKEYLKSLQVRTMSSKVRSLILEMNGRDCELCSNFKTSPRIVTDNEQIGVQLNPETRFFCDTSGKTDGVACTVSKQRSLFAGTVPATCYEVPGPGQAKELWCFEKLLVAPACELSAELASV
jgi:hypothetical protein